MRFTPLARRIAARLATFAMLLASLAPAVSSALAAANDQHIRWTAVCTADGTKIVPVPTDATGAPLAPEAHTIDHCPFCASNAASAALPPPAAVTVPAVAGADPVSHMKAIDVGGQPVTTLTVDSQSVFSKYKIKMLEGGSQNRLILRALSPVFARTVEANDWLSRLAMQASQQLTYGPGVNKLPDTAGRTPGSVMSAISAADSAHCGNYVFYFVNQLAAKARWQAFDLKARDGRNHSVAEVQDQGKTKTVDPTLGIVYNCSLQSMLDGHCNFNLANSTQTINPALQAFQGAGFFYGAVVVKKYSSIDDLVSAY